MILDDGICSIFTNRNTAGPGGMPVYEMDWLASSWYKILHFSSRPTYLQTDKESTTVALKIRIHQNLMVTNQQVVILSESHEVPASAVRYDIVRAYHGADDVTGMPITDLDLEVVTP